MYRGLSMMEWRRHPRVREQIPVRWSMPDHGLEGKGTVRNISISGMLLEIEGNFRPAEHARFVVEIADEKLSALVPHDAQLVWFNYTMSDKRRKFCGLRFVDPTGPAF